MAQQGELRWRGTPTPRAKPIGQEEWDKHKDELGELYQRMTLDQLTEVMKEKHGFAPS